MNKSKLLSSLFIKMLMSAGLVTVIPMRHVITLLHHSIVHAKKVLLETEEIVQVYPKRCFLYFCSQFRLLAHCMLA